MQYAVYAVSFMTSNFILVSKERMMTPTQFAKKTLNANFLNK